MTDSNDGLSHAPDRSIDPEHRSDPSAVSSESDPVRGKSAPQPSPSPDETSEIIESREVFLGAISHELRAPMAALKLSAQSLVRLLDTPDGQDSERSRLLASTIDRQADKLVKLIAYLLDVSRSGNG